MIKELLFYIRRRECVERIIEEQDKELYLTRQIKKRIYDEETLDLRLLRTTSNTKRRWYLMSKWFYPTLVASLVSQHRS